MPQNYSSTYQRVQKSTRTLLNCQCNVFLTMYSYYNSCFFKKDCCYRNNWYPIAWWWFRTLSRKRKKIDICSSCHLYVLIYVLLPIYMFWHSRFSFRNLKNANSCMFSWCIITSGLLICSWHDRLSQFLQWMYSICSESLLFSGISYVQGVFGLGGVNHGGRCLSVLVVLRWPMVLFDFWWRRWCAAHFGGGVFCALCGVLRWRGRWPRGFLGLGLHLWVYSEQFNTGT